MMQYLYARFARAGSTRFDCLRSLLLVPLLFTMLWSEQGHSESVSIAIAGPMIGTSSAVGVQYRIGVEAAIADLPQGRLLGSEIKLTAYDDSCNSEIAKVVAREIVSQRPQVVIGHSCSNATISAAPLYAKAGIVQITPASTNPKVTELGITSLFRMIGRDDLQGELAAERLAAVHAGQKIGMLRFPGTYSRGLSAIAQSSLARRGIKPTLIIEAKASATSYARQIEQFVNAEVDVIYLVGGGLDSAVFLRQRAQLHAPFAVVSADTLVSRVFIEAAGSYGENVPFTFPPDAADLKSSSRALERIRSMNQDPAGYTLLAYAAAEVWFEGVRRANSFDTAKVTAAIRERPIDTALGKISFDDKGDIRTEYAPFEWFVWQNGKRVSLDK